MAWIRANDPHTSSAFNGAAVHTYFLDRRLHFHPDISTLIKKKWQETSSLGGLPPISAWRILRSSDYPSSPAIRVELHGNLVSDKDLDPMKSHLSREVGEDSFTILDLYAEKRVGQSFLHHRLNDFRLLLVYHTRGHCCRDRYFERIDMCRRTITILSRNVNGNYCTVGSSTVIFIFEASFGKVRFQNGSIRARAASMPGKLSAMASKAISSRPTSAEASSLVSTFHTN